MSPAQHLEWFADNIAWFSNLTKEQMPIDVPNCPGWDVAAVLNHLTFGLGRAYPQALHAPVDGTAEQAFSAVDWPTELPVGQQAIDSFVSKMGACLATFQAADPRQPCWTYAGPGKVSFWFRRAAIETMLHLIDVAEALAVPEPKLATDRSIDGVADAVEFVLPLASQLANVAPGPMEIRETVTGTTFGVGDGSAVASLQGTGRELVAALWGRPEPGVIVAGDLATAQAWMGLAEVAFAGR